MPHCGYASNAAMTDLSLSIARAHCVALQPLRARRGRAVLLMLLVALALLVQGAVALAERAAGPAHLHGGAAASVPLQDDAHAQLHAGGVGHHHHEADDASVITVDDSADDGGPSSGLAKRLLLDQGAVPIDVRQAAQAAPAASWLADAASRFASHTPALLERPPC